MASPRDLFLKYLNKPSRIVPTGWLLNITNQKFVLPFYHAISDQPLPHIDNLYKVKTIKEFENDLEFLLKYFTPVDVFQFREITTGLRKSSKPAFLISFDDGLKEFHDIIAPLLLKKGIPAICFLNSAFIDNNDLFYKYKASLLVSCLQQTDINKKVKRWSNENSITDINSWLLSVDYANRHKLDEFAAAMGYDFQEYLASAKPYLTNTQIERLIKDGFHFGAHSIDHPEYRLLPLSEQIDQTTTSVAFVKQRYSLNYGLFSFPFTDYRVSDDFFKTVMSSGTVDLTFGCAGLKKEVYPFHFQRIAFERSNLRAEEIYKTELLYSSLQQLIGKNTIRRI